MLDFDSHLFDFSAPTLRLDDLLCVYMFASDQLTLARQGPTPSDNLKATSHALLKALSASFRAGFGAEVLGREIDPDSVGLTLSQPFQILRAFIC